MPVPSYHVRDELLIVLGLPPETFVYFDRPVTVTSVNGNVRDRAIGLWNYALDIHIFSLDENTGRLFACFGPVGKSYWYAFRDEALFDAYLIHQKAALESICYIREMDGTIVGERYDPA